MCPQLRLLLLLLRLLLRLLLCNADLPVVFLLEYTTGFYSVLLFILFIFSLISPFKWCTNLARVELSETPGLSETAALSTVSGFGDGYSKVACKT